MILVKQKSYHHIGNNKPASGTAMDVLKYTYYYINTGGAKLPYDPLSALPGDVKTLTNQLAYVTDDIHSNYTEDIDNQLAGNYDYDGIGNLIKDVQEGITSIAWNVYGKIKTITKTGTNISYTYDASGNRISKNVNGKETWYVRDATGNVLSVYTKDAAINNGSLTQKEIDIYGSSRLGILNKNNYVSLGSVVPGIGSHYYLSFTRGKKFFELSNHLGNVLTIVSDRKKPFAKTTNQNVVDFYVADIKSVRDYYPFGMEMPGRKFTSSSYRYGFNGKELDKEITSTTTYDYGFRIYSPGLGRFLSVDPMTKNYPWYTPYQFAGNKPIWAMDLDGQEDRYYTVLIVKNGIGQVQLESISEDETKAVLWYNLNQVGKLGRGNLFKVQFQTQDMDGKPVSLVTNYIFEQKAAKWWDKVKSATHPDGIIFSSSMRGAGSENQYEPYAMHPDKQIENIDGIISSSMAFKDIPGVEGFPSLLELSKGLSSLLGTSNKLIAGLLKSAAVAESLSNSKEAINAAKAIGGENAAKSKTQNSSTIKKTKNIYIREDNYFPGEPKGSIQSHAFVGDSTVRINRAKDNSGVDTFHIKHINH